MNSSSSSSSSSYPESGSSTDLLLSSGSSLEVFAQLIHKLQDYTDTATSSRKYTHTTNIPNGPKPTTKKELPIKEKMEVDDGSVMANGINGTKGEEKDDSLLLYQFSTNFRVAQEAVYVINKASEKFLQVFTAEAYANAFLDHKKHIAYKHLSSVVSKRKRFDFLSDFVHEKLKAEDALKDPQPVEN